MIRLTGLMVLMIGLALPAFGQQVVKIQQKAEAYSGVSLLTISSSAATTIWPTNKLSTTDGRILYRGIQNVGTNAFLYLIVKPGATATNASTTNYTGAVAGGLNVRDGLGSQVDLSRIPWPVSVITENGSTVGSVVELTQ